MTNEEAVTIIMGVMDNYHVNTMTNKRIYEALSMAIRALKDKKMTTEEAINRLEEGAPFSELYDETWERALEMAIEALKDKLETEKRQSNW